MMLGGYVINTVNIKVFILINLFHTSLCKEEHSMFTDWTAQEKKTLGLENLFHKCFPGETYNGNIIYNFKCDSINLFSSPGIGGCTCHEENFLQQLPTFCVVQPDYHHERVTSQFIIHFGSLCTKRMAKRLNEYNITFKMLKSTFEQNSGL